MEKVQNLPKTLKVINDLDDACAKLNQLSYEYHIDDAFEQLDNYETMLIEQTYMAIASTLYNESPEWAIKIAECILIMADLENKKIVPEIKWE